MTFDDLVHFQLMTNTICFWILTETKLFKKLPLKVNLNQQYHPLFVSKWIKIRLLTSYFAFHTTKRIQFNGIQILECVTAFINIYTFLCHIVDAVIHVHEKASQILVDERPKYQSRDRHGMLIGLSKLTGAVRADMFEFSQNVGKLVPWELVTRCGPATWYYCHMYNIYLTYFIWLSLGHYYYRSLTHYNQ